MGAKNLKLIQKRNTSIDDVHEEFLDNLPSPHSKRAYRQALNNFSRFVKSNLPGDMRKPNSWESVERKHIVSWKSWLMREGSIDGNPCAPKTVNQRLSAISEYFAFLINSNESPLELSPCTAIKRPKNTVKKPTNAITKKQFRDMLEKAKQHPRKAAYHTALLITFFRTGLRKSEIRNLKMDDFIDYGDHSILRVRTKGGKLRTIILHPEVVSAIKEHIDKLEKIGRKRLRGSYLFPTPQNPHSPDDIERPWNPDSLLEFFQTYAKRAEIFFNVTPHSARATLITNLLAQGNGIYAVAKEVGHASVSTTEIYDKRRKEKEDSLLTDYDI